MTNFDEIFKAALNLTKVEKLKLASKLTVEYDGTPLEALAEAWAQDVLKMKKTQKGAKGVDGIYLSGRKLQVKSKKSGAHSDSATYVTLSKGTIEYAEDLLVVFVNHETGDIDRSIGPIPIDCLIKKNERINVSDMIKVGALDDKPPFNFVRDLILNFTPAEPALAP